MNNISHDEYYSHAKKNIEEKNYEKAIQSYKILILKFPEKNSYFADQIKKIKKLKKWVHIQFPHSHCYSCIFSCGGDYGSKP